MRRGGVVRRRVREGSESHLGLILRPRKADFYVDKYENLAVLV